MPQSGDGQILYQLIVDVLQNRAGVGSVGFALLALLMTIMQALYLHHIALNHKLFHRVTYLPSFTYILLSGLYVPYASFSPALLANWALLIGLDASLAFNQTPQQRKLIFNAGFAYAAAALVEYQSGVFFFLLFLALLLHRSFNPGEWIVALMGYLTPLYFAAGLLFLTDNLPLSYRLSHVLFYLPVRPRYVVQSAALIGGCVFLFMVGAVAVRVHLNKATIYVRRGWIQVLFHLIIGLVIALFSGINHAQWLICFLPLSLFIAYAFQLEKSSRFSSFTFYFSLLWLIFCQLAVNK